MGFVTLSGHIHTNTGNEPNTARTVNVYEGGEAPGNIVRTYTTSPGNGSWVLYNVELVSEYEYWVKCEGLDTDDFPYVYTATGGDYSIWVAGTDSNGNGQYYGWNTDDVGLGNQGMNFQETS